MFVERNPGETRLDYCYHDAGFKHIIKIEFLIFNHMTLD